MDRFVYHLYRIASRIVRLLPLGLGFRLGAAAGWLAYWVAGPYRRLVLRNLAIALGGEKTPRERRRIARAHFACLGGNLISSVKIASLPAGAIPGLVKVDEPGFTEARNTGGRGVVLAIGHVGNWEILAQLCPLIFPQKGGAIYQRLGNRFIDAEVRAARERQGMTLFERKDGFQKAIALIRSGGGVGILVDQHAGDAGLWCPFFGRLASTSPLAATLALRTGALVIPAAIYTEGPGRWRMAFEPSIPLAGHDADSLTAEINRSLEKLIRGSLPDWFWVHNRWKTPRPNFLLSRYKRGIALPRGFDPGQLKPFRILVRSTNWLGDAVMTTPAVRELKNGRPDAHLTVLVKAKLAEYWRRVPEVDEVIEIAPGDSVFSVARKLRRREPFEVAVLFPNSVRSALEVWLAGVPRRAGYPAKWRTRLLNQLILPSRTRQLPEPAPHQVEHYLEMARKFGADTGGPRVAPAEVFQTSLLAKPATPPVADGPGRAPVRIGLCPGAEYGPAKRWLPERFAEAARLVAGQRDCEWALFGVNSDAPIGNEIARRMEEQGVRHVNLIGKTTLAELMDRLSECRLLLTNDTGTMHLAAALGVPTVSIFGSTEPSLTGPLGPGHTVLRHQVECSPCFQRVCPIDFRCMKAITAEEVAAAVIAAIPCG